VSYIAEAVQRARHLGASPEGAAAWRELLAQTHVDEADYSDWARELSGLYARLGRQLSAARIHEYLLNIDPALALYTKHGTPRDLGRVLRFGRRLKEAAARYKEAGLYAHAGRAAEEAGDAREALLSFEQLVRQKEAQGDRYLSGLASLNAGRLAAKQNQPERAHALLATAVRVLEEEGDVREQKGDREGAFRCYLSLIQIGKIENGYEHFAEGYLNCIRILKAKSDRFFTMQYYFDSIAHADELGELHSVAELYREAGEYAKRVGFIYADYFLNEAGMAWLRVADRAAEANQPAELVENALLAAIGCSNRIEDDDAVAQAYARLSGLALPDKKRERYETLAKELAAVAAKRKKKEPPPAFPEYFRRRLQLPEIWLRDLLEAESGTDIPDAIGRLVGDHKNVWEVQRRKALLIALSFDDHVHAGGDPEHVPPALIEKIGELGHPAAVRPLVAMYEHGDEAARVLVVERGSALKQREAFSLIDKALSQQGKLRDAGVTALRRMTFAQALDSLVRIFNTYESADVREACLKSIATIGTDEACEFILDVVRSNAGNLAIRARALLEQNAQERMLSALERNRRQEPDQQLRLFISRLIDKVRTQRGASF
jgi:tetratricopeptide (TPR) repeat protein